MSGAVPYPAGGHRQDFVGRVSAQLEMFEGADPLVGIEVNLPRHCHAGMICFWSGLTVGLIAPLCIALVVGVIVAGFQTRPQNSSVTWSSTLAGRRNLSVCASPNYPSYRILRHRVPTQCEFPRTPL